MTSFSNFFKGLGWALLLFMVIIICFYFWAGSSTVEKAKYYTLKQHEVVPEKVSDTLKIMTYNIGYLSGMTNNLPVDRSDALMLNNLSRSISFLTGANAAIIAMQEIDFYAKRSKYINQLDSFAVHANYSYSAKAINWDKSYVPFPYWPMKHHFGRMVSGQAIISKLQIIDQEVTVLEKPASAPFYYNKFYLDRLVQVAFVKVNDSDTLVVMNTHLEAFDQETRAAQSKVVVNLFNHYALDFPVILLGDFNAIPPFEDSALHQESTLVDLFNSEEVSEAIDPQEYLANKERFYTFDSENPYERLDYIFYTKKQIKKVASGVAQEAGVISDHLPVWMTFTLID